MNKQPNKAIGENERRPDVSVRFVDHKLTSRHMKAAKRRAKSLKATSGHKVVSLMRIRRLYKDANPYLSSLVAKQLLVGRAPEGAIKPEDAHNFAAPVARHFFDVIGKDKE